ncbi:MAG: uL15 family ribosomal protein [Patescibacteria group bacterium]
MIGLHTLPKITTKAAKRRGRGLGSNKGSKSGRGTTRHQTARTDIPLHFEGGQGRIVKKYPLLRGKSKNKSIVSKPFTLRLSKLMSLDTTDIITIEVLKKSGLIPEESVSVKIVFDGPVEKPLKVMLPVSAKVKEAITQAKGSIEG